MNHRYKKSCIALSVSSAISFLSAIYAPASFAQETVDLGTVGGSGNAGSTVSVKVAPGTAQAVAPAQASLEATQPQAIISRAFIESSTPPTGNFNTIMNIAPSITTPPTSNGPGLADSKSALRGFSDGNYNVTFDGIPFGDTNGPSHHSTSYFPASVIGGLVIERGPGNASNLGYATYGGTVNLFSLAPSATEQKTIYGSIGRWGTQLAGLTYQSGRMKGSDATLQINLQDMQSNGYLTNSYISDKNATIKYQRPLGDTTLITLFSSYSVVKTDVPDNSNGTTSAQALLLGKNYYLNNNPLSQGYFGYNIQNKKTDMEYIRIQSAWDSGWQSDNNTYTYSYVNKTRAGNDPALYNGTIDSPLAVGATAANQVVNFTSSKTTNAYTSLSGTDVPGYDKLNGYRVFGNILKATRQFDSGLARVGLWYEHSLTGRHNLEMDLTTGQLLPGVTQGLVTSPAGIVTATNFAQQSSTWSNMQPFAEYEWAALPTWTITPGMKYMATQIQMSSAWNQGSAVAGTAVGSTNIANVSQSYNFKYDALLPFLTVHKKIDSQNSAYFQYAQGMLVPFVNNGLPTSTAPQPQLTKNFQLGAVHKSDQLVLDGDIYYIPQSNTYANSGTNAVPVYTNLGSSLYKGIEGQATYSFKSGYAAYLNISKMSANTDTTGDARISSAPNGAATVGALYNQGPWNASLLYKLIGRQKDSTLGTLAPIPNTDLNVAYTFKNPGFDFKSIKVQVSLFNLTNSQRLLNAKTDPYNKSILEYSYQAPRSAMLSAKAMF